MIELEAFGDPAVTELFEKAPFSLRCDLLPAKAGLLSKAKASIEKSTLYHELQDEAKSLLEASLYLAWDCIDEAHELVNLVLNETGSLIHCIIHRIEGDLPNCAYWYRRCQSHALNENLLELLRELSPDTVERVQQNDKLDHAKYGALELSLGESAHEYRRREVLILINYIKSL